MYESEYKAIFRGTLPHFTPKIMHLHTVTYFIFSGTSVNIFSEVFMARPSATIEANENHKENTHTCFYLAMCDLVPLLQN